MLEVGWWGIIKGSFQNILKQGVGKGKFVRRGEGDFDGVTSPAPRKISIIHHVFSGET